MGEIFLARLEGAAGFEKLYVVKRILPHLADDARFRQMLIAEARLSSKLSHANICQVYELGETDGQLYIVMEYLEGVTLLPLLRRTARQGTPLDLGLVAGIVQQTCDALNYAHELKDQGQYVGLVHRDVTPSNIFLTESGVTKILDFGIAKAKGASTNTQEGTVKGKYAYMAPEQLKGGEIDRRVDLFALGVVVFEMLALRRLFQRKTDYLTFRAVMEQPIPDIRRYRPDVPEALAMTLARALDRDAERRFESARQLQGVLLDSLGFRPWSQGEISDFVRGQFADDLANRANAVSAAVNRKPSGITGGRAGTMPVIAPAEPDAHEGDDDDGFPSVETDVDLQPPFQLPPPTGPLHPIVPTTAPSDDSTPPPFAAETTGNALRLDPLSGLRPAPGGTMSSPVIVVNKRSILWPLLAIAGVAIAGAALYLVYQQTQQPKAPPTVNIIQQDQTTKPPPPQPTPPPPPDPGPAPGPGSGSAVVVVPPTQPVVHPPVHPGGNPYLAAISPHLGAMTQCLHDHPDGDVPTVATITIAPNGKTKSVSWKPDSLDASPLGGCLKNVLMTVQFPKDKDDATINWSPSLSRAKG
jgi:serine/threonine-protein kinase